MPTRYEYDLDGNREWRWIAIAANGATIAVSPVGYVSLQDCMHAVGLMHAPGNLAVTPGVSGINPTLPQGVVPGVPPGVPPGAVSRASPDMSLSRLHRRP